MAVGLKTPLVAAIPLAIIFIIGMAVFWVTFNLYPFGDNWMVFWGGKISFGVSQGFTNWRTYFSPYGLSYLILFFINKFFGYSGTALYFFSFLARYLSATGLYFFLRDIKINRFGVFIGTLLYLISPIGLETTDWAFQMSSYISIFFLLLVIRAVFKISSWKRILELLFFFLLSVGFNPIRAHGTILLVIILLIVETVIIQKSRKYTLAALILMTLLLAIMSRMNTFGDPQNTLGMLIPGVTKLTEAVKNGNFALFQNYLIGVSNTLLPDRLVDWFSGLGISNRIFGNYRPLAESLTIPILFLLLLNFWKIYLWKNKSTLKWVFWLFTLNIVLLVGFYKLLGYAPESITNNIKTLVGQIFILNLLAFMILDFWKKSYRNLRVDIISLGFVALYLILPWVTGPDSFLPSYHRYLVYGSITLPILIAVILNRNIQTKSRELILMGFVVAVLVLLSYYSITSYFVNRMLFTHSKVYAERVWSNIDKVLPRDFSNRKILVYIVGDEPERVYQSVVFGFGFHAGTRYDIWEQSNLPTVITDASELRSMIEDGEVSKKYIGVEYVYPKKDVYLLKIEGTSVRSLKKEEVLNDKF